MASVMDYVQQILDIDPYQCQLDSADRPPCPFEAVMMPIITAAQEEHPYEGVFWAMRTADGQGRTCEGSEVHFDAVLYMKDPTFFDDLTRRQQGWLRIFEQDDAWHAEVIATGYSNKASTPRELLQRLEADHAAGADMGADTQRMIDYFKYVTIYMLEKQN